MTSTIQERFGILNLGGLLDIGILKSVGIAQMVKVLMEKAMGLRVVCLKLSDGQSLCVDASQIPDVFRNIAHIYYYKDYEPLDVTRPRSSWIVVDVGAYIGVYTLYAARLVGENGLVIALEPIHENVKYLIHNIRLNSLKNVFIVPQALHIRCGYDYIYVPRYRANASLIRHYVHAMYYSYERLPVRCTTLNEVLRRVGVDQVDLLKLDVEGFELEILRHTPRLEDIVRRIVIEVHTEVVDLNKIVELLENRGFRVIVRVDEALPIQAFVVGF